MKRALYEDYTIWEPDGYDPVTFWYTPLDIAVALALQERMATTGRPTEQVKERHGVMLGAVVGAVTRWDGFEGDPECTKEAREKFFGMPANGGALLSVWGAINGNDPNAANKKKALSDGSVSSLPTRRSSAENAETPEASNGAATS